MQYVHKQSKEGVTAWKCYRLLKKSLRFQESTQRKKGSLTIDLKNLNNTVHLKGGTRDLDVGGGRRLWSEIMTL